MDNPLKDNPSHSFVIPQVLLGQLLIDNNLITAETLETALQAQKQNGRLLGKILLELGMISEDALLPVLAGQLNVGWLRLKGISIAPEVLALIPVQFISHYQVIPVRLDQDKLTVATAFPSDIQMLDEIALAVDYRLNPVLAGEAEIMEAIRGYYGVGADTIEKMMGKAKPAPLKDDDAADLDEIGSEASISTFLNQILLEAYKDADTDIHPQPFYTCLLIVVLDS